MNQPQLNIRALASSSSTDKPADATDAEPTLAVHASPQGARATGAQPRDNSDAADVEKARTGDIRAFEALVRRYRNDVFALAHHFVRNREEAWDISQEVFIKAHRALRRFRGDASFKTWLMRITANQCKDYLKKRRIQTVAFDDAVQAGQAASAGQAPDEALASSELGEAITKALETLSHKHKTVFILREFEGLSYEEMAEVIGCSLGTVMSRLHHARKKLQHQLIRMGVVEGD